MSKFFMGGGGVGEGDGEGVGGGDGEGVGAGAVLGWDTLRVLIEPDIIWPPVLAYIFATPPSTMRAKVCMSKTKGVEASPVLVLFWYGVQSANAPSMVMDGGADSTYDSLSRPGAAGAWVRLNSPLETVMSVLESMVNPKVLWASEAAGDADRVSVISPSSGISMFGENVALPPAMETGMGLPPGHDKAAWDVPVAPPILVNDADRRVDPPLYD